MTTPGPLLRLNGVTKSFGGVQALASVSCEVGQGAIVGIIGPNGAGKTTAFNVITGATQPDGGRIELDGHSIAGERPHRIAQRGISRTFQNIRLFAGMTVWEHLLVAQPHRGASVRRFLPTHLADPVALRRAMEVLEFFGLQDVRNRNASSLPYGMQRKVEIARAVTSRPRLLLLDEPVAGMNHDEAEHVRQMVLSLSKGGLSILLIEHDMIFVMGLCEYLYVFDFGVVIAEGSPGQVRNNPAVLDAYLGRDN